MGEYNPNIPVILGQEWVPIREEDLAFDEAVNAFEQGHGFTLATARTVGFGRFYVREPPNGIYENQAYTMTVYQKDMVDSAGPIRRVLIPVGNGAIAGAGVIIFSPDTTVPEALNNPGTSLQRGIDISSGSGTECNVSINFAVTDYTQPLDGKRILAVNLLYQYRMSTTVMTTETDGDIFFYLTQAASPFGFQYVFPSLATANPVFPPPDTRQFVRRRVGDVAMYYRNTPFTQVDVIPWTFDELLKFEGGSVGEINTHIRSLAFADVGPRITINYMALEVFYCDENRTLFGTRIFNASPMAAADEVRINWGANDIYLHSVANEAADDPILQAGEYVVTVAEASMGDNVETLSNFGPQAKLNAIRELYPMPLQPGVRLDIPFPLDESAINRQLTEVSTEILPQLSLHTSGSGTTLTEPHPYGRQAWAQVWGSNVATQELSDTGAGATRSYPWVRFYARRWGDTTVPLTIAGTGGLSGSTVSITPAEFDELPEILDGWKQVDLRFSTPPALGALTSFEFQWTASGELAGNRWEVLGAVAPALDPLVGDYYNQVALQQQLYEATYEAPTGSIRELDWYPQGVADVFVSAGSADDASDATILLSVDPPAVSGFEIANLCQPVSGIGQQCDIDPCCIPTSIDFVQLTWDTVPASGFGHYEIQRMDELTDWATIMEGTAVTGTTFNDFEARVGILSSYRIRVVNLYEFTGPWSDTITATVPEPGVTIGCQGDGHLLIFTSNERQSGAINLAYSSVWMDQQVEESFTFPEAGFVQLQPMYDKDYFTAFRPLERGGEQFQRTVLVQAAAISPETLGDFTSLRDMAWTAVNYICVRDEDGNRWFATVAVPSGRVMNRRKLYMAPVQIVEVTDTPTPVDPADTTVAGTVMTTACE